MFNYKEYCPVCGKEAYRQSWGGWMEPPEVNIECTNKKCKGYKYHDFINKIDYLKVGDWEWTGLSGENEELALKEFNLRCRYYKKRRVRK